MITQTLKGTQYFYNVESRTTDVQAAFHVEVLEQILAVLKDRSEVELLRRMEDESERGNEGVSFCSLLRKAGYLNAFYLMAFLNGP